MHFQSNLSSALDFFGIFPLKRVGGSKITSDNLSVVFSTMLDIFVWKVCPFLAF
jgi:hypothetical protein